MGSVVAYSFVCLFILLVSIVACRIKALTIRAVVCVNIGSAAISTVIFTIFSIQYTIIAIIISMPARWCAFQTITIIAIGVPSTEIIEATSSTIIIAVSIVVLVIAPLICGPMPM